MLQEKPRQLLVVAKILQVDFTLLCQVADVVLPKALIRPYLVASMGKLSGITLQYQVDSMELQVDQALQYLPESLVLQAGPIHRYLEAVAV
jgi:hypothetical protein